MKKLFFIGLTVFVCNSSYTIAQTKNKATLANDSTLYNLVNTVYKAIKERAKSEGYPDYMMRQWSSDVILEDGEHLLIDSLVGLKINDYKSINIRLDYPPPIGGSKGHFGLIHLEKKKE